MKHALTLAFWWSLATAAVTAAFWTVWFLVNGDVPVVDSGFIGPLSRWWDVLNGPVFLMPLAFLKAWLDTEDEREYDRRKKSPIVIYNWALIAGLAFGLAMGLPAGLILCVAIGTAMFLWQCFLSAYLWLLPKHVSQKL